MTVKKNKNKNKPTILSSTIITFHADTKKKILTIRKKFSKKDIERHLFGSSHKKISK